MNPNAVMPIEPRPIEDVPFDIETTGIHPLETEIVSFVCGEFNMIQSSTRDELFVLKTIKQSVELMNKSTTTIITFKGGTLYSPGFDFPYLRTKFLKYGLAWPFKGYNHIDLFPIITKWFDLDFNELGTLNDLDAAGLKKFAIHFGLKAETTIKNNIVSIKEMVSEDQINEHLSELQLYKNKSHNGLKDACIHLLRAEDDGMRGEKVPGMFKEWKETHNDVILDNILEYNKADCEKTMRLFGAVRSMVPNRILLGELL